MPYAAAKGCTKPGCSGLIRNGVCTGCGPQRQKRDRTHDNNRGTAHQRGYGSNWQKLRRMHLAREPLCYDCKNNGGYNMGGGVLTVATEVHHIIAKRDGGDNSFDNLMSLCKTCHSKRTARGGQ